MNKKGQMNVGAIVVLFMGIVVAIALLVPIFNTQAEMTNLQSADNETVSAVGAYLGAAAVNESFVLTIYEQSTWKQEFCPLTSVVIRNGAETVMAETTDYVIDEDAGTFTLVDSAKTAPGTSENLTYVDYSYCLDGYNKDSGSRNIATLIGLFATLALMAFVLEKSGITNWTGIN